MVSLKPWGALELLLAHNDLHGRLSILEYFHGCPSQFKRFSMVV